MIFLSFPVLPISTVTAATAASPRIVMNPERQSIDQSSRMDSWRLSNSIDKLLDIAVVSTP